MHILLPSHELGSTEIYTNSIDHPRIGDFFNILKIHSALAWRNKTFGHGTHAEREGKLKVKAYWDFKEEENDALVPDTLANLGI